MASNTVAASGAKNKKVLVMAGGTGGHIFPGLALAQEMCARGHQVEWLGTKEGLESQLVPKNNITLHIIPVKGVRGKGLAAKAVAPLNIASSVFSAAKIIRKFRPDVVVGLGGFVAGPGGLGARMLGIPLIIHEQNAVAGTTNRLLAKIAAKVVTAFPSQLKDAECIGNPVRKEIESIPAPSERMSDDAKVTKLLILGGSRGAQAINELVPQALSQLNCKQQLEVWHQAGANKSESTEKAYSRLGLVVKVEAFIDDMKEAYTWADFVVCRAGALTVFELAAVGVGSLLIPFPYAIDDHQTANASYLGENGAAVVRQQDQLSVESLSKLLESLLFDKPKLLQMANKARSLAKLNSAKIFADRCEELAHA